MSDETKETRIHEVLMDYLKKDTDYAVMLTAPWGAGKTHFMKNVVFKSFENEYTGVLVSLYGIKHVDDIKNRILMELYPVIAGNFFKGATGLVKLLCKTVDIGGIFNISAGLDEAEKIAKNISVDSIDIKKLVLCFDDLERANPDMLTTNEVLGYINSLVEDQNIKVIVIANEDKIQDEKYHEIKEKIIGITLHFAQDFDDAFESILKDVKYSTGAFQKDVREHKDIIKNMLHIGGMNFRTLKYFLSYFQSIAHFIHSIKQPALEPYRESLFTEVLRFTLMISIEFKKGQISFRENKRLDSYIMISAIRKLAASPSLAEDYNQKIIAGYYANDPYYYYQSLYDYITGGNIFKELDFLNEIYKCYHISNQTISDAYKSFNQLAHSELHKLSDKGHRQLLKDIRRHLNQGEYQAHVFMNIFHYLTRFGNPLNLNKNTLLKEMLLVLKKNQHKYPYEPNTDRYTQIDGNSDDVKYYQPLRKRILEINENARLVIQNEINQTVDRLYFTDLSACYDAILKHSEYDTRITFSGILPARFLSHYLKCSNSDKDTINKLILIAYDPSRGSLIHEDLNFLRQLKLTVENSMSDKVKKNISGWLLGCLLDNINIRLNSLGYVFQTNSDIE